MTAKNTRKVEMATMTGLGNKIMIWMRQIATPQIRDLLMMNSMSGWGMDGWTGPPVSGSDRSDRFDLVDIVTH